MINSNWKESVWKTEREEVPQNSLKEQFVDSENSSFVEEKEDAILETVTTHLRAAGRGRIVPLPRWIQ